jgi:hypothetical protein
MDAPKFAITKLNNNIYPSWKFKMEMFLIRENLWKYIEPGIPPNPVTEIWNSGDQKVKENSTSISCWIVDSGATSHMCCEKIQFVELNMKSSTVITLGNENQTLANSIGKVNLKTVDQNGSFVNLTLSNVLYVPNLESNLISVSKLIENNVCVIFD